jgi:pyrimidine operon attenuation protein / uracil phosphoribosyltransferase
MYSSCQFTGRSFLLSEIVLLTPAEINRSLTRIAHEIIEKNEGAHDIILAGMLTRGMPLARRLADIINKFENIRTPVIELDFRYYRDAISNSILPISKIHETNIPIDITGKIVVLVDDVLFTGRSIRAAMDALVHIGRPKCVQLAVLIDRGHREFPIKADYVGKNIPSSTSERIQVKLTETDDLDAVIIRKMFNNQLLRF